MDINLSWDLFVIVFFTVIIAYSFIIGRNRTLKVIVATYIAILAADGIGNLINRFLIGNDPMIRVIEISGEEESVILVKILIFIIALVLIVMRGRFEIHIEKTRSPSMNVLINFAYGILSAGLIISTILIYINGSFAFQGASETMGQAMQGIYDQSYMVRAMLQNANVWLSLPAITFVIASFIGDEA